MSRAILTLALSAFMTLALAACGGGSASTAPSTAASAAPPASAPAAAAACEETTDPGDVAVNVKDFAFDSTAITAKVGQVIAFTNTGAAPHTATLDDGTCTAPNIAAGAADGLTFSVAGSSPFHCAIRRPDEGHDHRHRVRTAGLARAFDLQNRGARRQVDEQRLGELRGREPLAQLLACRESRALVELVDLDALISSPWRVRNSSVVDGRGQSRTRSGHR